MTIGAVAFGLLAQPFATAAQSAPSPLERPRAIFVEVYPEAERGNWEPVEALSDADRAALERYPLWPDLEAAWLKANVATLDATRIENFLERYGAMKPARDLRYRYALHLAQAGQHSRYLELYRSFYQGLDVARLDCHALAAEIAVGEARRVTRRALGLWMTGESQADECDPVFAWLEGRGELTAAHYSERFDLAIGARQFTRARWLGKALGDAWVAEAEAWQRVAADPEAYLRSISNRETDETGLDRLRYGFERLTYADPLVAAELWSIHADRHPFSVADRIFIERHIALWTARDGLPGAYERLAALPPAARNDEVLRWRARVSLRAGAWRRLLDDIAAMPDAEASQDEWQYWRAIALERSAAPDPARAILTELAGERSYYGFLAADAIGRPYQYADAPLGADDTLIAELAGRPELVRARELYFVGLDSRGRSEWDTLVKRLSRDEQQQAALLAHRWGWHSRAIATAARLAEFDDLEIRYPLPYPDDFERGSAAARIPATWALGVARSESLFMRDVRSRAGAVGVMQLMPATGRAVARRIDIDFAGLDSLTDPATNIRLGTSYLGEMTERFGGNRVLATAAYNAGPHRVDAWLPQAAPVETRIWIENIPFNETRKYVRRVLAAETIFHWRMTGETRRLSDVLGAILPLPSVDESVTDETVARLGADTMDRHLDQ